MLADESFRRTLGNVGVATPNRYRSRCRSADTWRPGLEQDVDVGAMDQHRRHDPPGVFALLTSAAVAERLPHWVFPALIVAAAGWAGLEVARRSIDNALMTRFSGDIREVADVMLAYAEDSLHHWLNLTLATGGVLVVFGVLVAMLGGVRRRDV